LDLQEVHSLRGLKYLHSLWLEDNPCTSVKDYRKFVIYMLPRICKLDGIEISNEERERAEADMSACPIVPSLNINGAVTRNLSKPPPVPVAHQFEPSPQRRGSREPSPRGFDSPRIIVGETPRGPTPGSRPPSPYLVAQDSPRQMPAMTGETNKHVLSAILSLVKELNLDGLACC